MGIKPLTSGNPFRLIKYNLTSLHELNCSNNKRKMSIGCSLLLPYLFYLLHNSTAIFRGSSTRMQFGWMAQPALDGSSEPCDWPNPLYSPALKNMSSLLQSVGALRRAFQKQPSCSFSYIDSGGALGLFRDGSILVPSDSDLDIRYGIVEGCDIPGQSLTSFHEYISLNNFVKYGDKWTLRAQPSKVTVELVTKVKANLCLNHIGGGEFYWTHREYMQRRSLIYTYGDFWFVRAPFKGVRNPETWFDYAMGNGSQPWQSVWEKSNVLLQQIDKNRDSNITVQEVTDHVIADGILPHAYDAQISSKERCRAAALMTFLLKCDINPYICRIPARPEMSTQGGGNENTLFEFAECE
jgi:hypothetical protein